MKISNTVGIAADNVGVPTSKLRYEGALADGLKELVTFIISAKMPKRIDVTIASNLQKATEGMYASKRINAGNLVDDILLASGISIDDLLVEGEDEPTTA